MPVAAMVLFCSRFSSFAGKEPSQGSLPGGNAASGGDAHGSLWFFSVVDLVLFLNFVESCKLGGELTFDDYYQVAMLVGSL